MSTKPVRSLEHNFEAYLADAEARGLAVLMTLRRDPITGTLLIFTESNSFDPGVEWFVTGAIVASAAPRKKV